MLDKLSSNGKGILKGCIACRAVTEERTILFAVCCCWWLNDAFFLHKLQQRLPILVRGSDNPQKCLFPRGILTPSNPWFLGPTWVSLQTASRSVQPFLHSTSLWPIHRQTHRHATSVAICHILCTACMQRSLKIAFWHHHFLFGRLLHPSHHLSDTSI